MHIYDGNNGTIVKIEGLNDELVDNHITVLRFEKFIYVNNSDNKVARKFFVLVIDNNDNLYFTTDEANFFQFKN